MARSFQAVLLTAVASAALGAGAEEARAATYVQTDLVSDLSALGATITDPSLKNPWGLSFLPGSPIWVSNQGSRNSTLYGVTGATVTKEGLTVAIPPSGAAGPTGQVANTNASAFGVAGSQALFIFANLNGSISAWNGSGTTAVTALTTPGAAYTGLAINQANTLLYAANGAGGGGIDVFNGSFAPAALPAGAFATPAAIKTAGLVPFNVKDINGSVYVTYAPSGHAAQTGATKGMGALAVFGEDGTLESSSFIADELASPWGLALAPSTWGQFGGDLLVGNFAFGDSVIDALDPTTWALEGMIAIDDGGQSPGGLWSLAFGGGGNDGNPDTLFITDGLNGETDGLLASITTVPEPSTWAMMLAGFARLALFAARRRPPAIAPVG
ncbi:MAG TPA: TIGR03118 family protein [Roseiarcus sp.]|jgi:uncharacterized protein (TIGR03118 family)